MIKSENGVVTIEGIKPIILADLRNANRWIKTKWNNKG